MSGLTRRLHLLAALAGGAVAGLSLPPIGWWWMAPIGLAGIAWGLQGRRLRTRLLVGLVGGIGQFSISLAWALQFNIGGYVVLALVEACFVALACALVPPGRGRIPGFAGALVLSELARQSWPFGGLPLGGIPLGQMGGPLGADARVGGPLLVMGVTALAGAALAALLPPAPALAPAPEPAPAPASAPAPAPAPPGSEVATPASSPSPRATPLPALTGMARFRRLAAALTALAATAALAIAGVLAPDGANPSTGKRLTVSIVQGGGQRGLDQLQVPASRVFEAAVAATAGVPKGTQLILWPEDVVGLNVAFPGSNAEKTLESLARQHDATLVAGVTYPVGTTQFRNEIVAFSPSGQLVATFEKVHRVPFGEYVPDRGFFKHLANLDDIPRDAIPGHASGEITTPATKAAVLVSYEVFFADRGRSGVRAGGQVIVVPTNTSSYTSSQAPAQEIAASRMQAIEEGRFVLQAAPTGYSAVVDSEGNVLERTPLTSRDILSATIVLMQGSTWFQDTGDDPTIAAALAFLLGAWLAEVSLRASLRRRRRTSPSNREPEPQP